jgi:ribose transport system ATP-binding protein
MHEGKLAGFLQGEHVTEENIMKLASGASLSLASGVSLP